MMDATRGERALSEPATTWSPGREVQLRDYQARAVRELARRLRKYRRVVGVAPTGSGKSVIGAALVASMPRKTRVLWIAHRVELLRQAQQHLIDAGVTDVGMLSGDERTHEGSRVVVASIDALRRRPLSPVDLIIVDEAHRIEAKTYQAILALAGDAKVLGLTATPWRLGGKGLGGTFANMLVMADVAELVLEGFIAQPETYGIPEQHARAIVADLPSDHGDYASGALGRAMMKSGLVGNVVEEVARRAPGVATIVFACTRAHARALARRFVAAGRSTAYLDGDTSGKERDQILGQLRVGQVEVVVNVDVLTEGFDCPPVKCISIVRPTKSLTRFLQYCGRASRPHKGQHPIIIDHAGNCHRHGLPDAPRVWSLDDLPRALWHAGSPVKQCVKCKRLIPASWRMCSHIECGASQPQSERDFAEEHAELERLHITEAQRLARFAEVTAMATRRNLGHEWVMRAMRILDGDE